MQGKAIKPAPASHRREHPRYRCEFPVVVSLFSGDGHQRLNAHCRDVSENGIGVLLAADLNPGEVASLAFTLPDHGQPWNVRAVLRHRRGYHYGFEFVSLTDREEKTLKSYMEDLERADTED